VAACTRRSAPDPKPEILIGAVLPLSGALASLGTSAQKGIELAITEANAAGGVRGTKIALRSYDDQSKLEEATNAITRLVSHDGAKMVVGEIASSNSMAIGYSMSAPFWGCILDVAWPRIPLNSSEKMSLKPAAPKPEKSNPGAPEPAPGICSE